MPRLIPIIIGIAGKATWTPKTAAYIVKNHLFINIPNNVTIIYGTAQYIAVPIIHQIILAFRKFQNFFINL